MINLTGLLGSTPSCLGAFVLAYVPLAETPTPTPTPTQPILGGDWIPPWKKEKDKDRDKEKGLKDKEEEDMMAVMLTLLSTE